LNDQWVLREMVSWEEKKFLEANEPNKPENVGYKETSSKREVHSFECLH
jgi:hypothetical protein